MFFGTVIFFAFTTQSIKAVSVDENIRTRDTVVASYIKFDGIEGEALDGRPSGWFKLASFEHHMVGGDRTLETMLCGKWPDKASGKLNCLLRKISFCGRNDRNNYVALDVFDVRDEGCVGDGLTNSPRMQQ